MTLYFEDFTVGTVRELGSFSLSEVEIIEFAERYDPQSIHVDPAASQAGPYGGLIASGWQTAGCCMRLLVEGMLGEAASMGATGLEEVRWPAPTRPGQRVEVTNEILDTRASQSRDDRGYVRNQTVGRHDGDVVISWIGTNIICRRDS